METLKTTSLKERTRQDVGRVFTHKIHRVPEVTLSRAPQQLEELDGERRREFPAPALTVSDRAIFAPVQDTFELRLHL